MSINYYILPKHLQNDARRYIEQGIVPGGFLAAVFCNDLQRAWWETDNESVIQFSNILNFVRGEAPENCWGSYERMADWVIAKAAERSAKGEG